MELMRVENLSKHFGGLMAVHDVSFSVNKGEILALIGPNGAGKTTLLNIFSGMYQPTRGKVLFNGRDVVGASPDRIARLGVARTFQLVKLISEMTVLENVMVGQHRHAQDSLLHIIFRLKRFHAGEKAMFERSRRALEFVMMKDLAQAYPGALSYGQRRLAEIARALVSEPILLLLDEPAAGLNTGEAARLQGLIKAVNQQGVTIILVEHNMRLVDGVSDRVVVLHYGEKIGEGSFDEIRKAPAVVKAYLGRTNIGKISH